MGTALSTAYPIAYLRDLWGAGREYDKHRDASNGPRSTPKTEGLLDNLRNPKRERTVYLIRHGQTADNVPGGEKIHHRSGEITESPGKVLSGQNEVPLTRIGWKQAKQTGRLLKERRSAENLRNATWMCSPQRRTRETLRGVLETFGDDGSIEAAVHFDWAIAERNAGELQGMTWETAGEHWDEMKKGREASVFHDADARYPGENGESLRMVHERAVPALEKTLQHSDCVAVIAHELTNKTLLAHLLDGGLNNDAFERTVENGKPIVLREVEGRWRIVP